MDPLECGFAIFIMALGGLGFVFVVRAVRAGRDPTTSWPGWVGVLAGISVLLGIAILVTNLEEMHKTSEFEAAVKPLKDGKASPEEAELILLNYVGDGSGRSVRRARVMRFLVHRPGTAALVGRLFQQCEADKDVIASLIRESVPGSEAHILIGLDLGGADSQKIAELLLNSGNPKLRAAAEDWAKKRNLEIVDQGGSPTAKWKSE